jgi:Tol biopolymer transport system component
MAAAMLAAGLAGGACGGGNVQHPVRPGSPEGALVYQGSDGQSNSIRLLLPTGADEPLSGLAATGAVGPSFSAAGLIAFKGDRSGQPVLVLHAWRDDAERVLDVGTLWPAAPALSPDGTTIAFEGTDGAAPTGLYVAPVAGGTPVLVAPTAATNAGPAWAPDGQQLYFGSNRTKQWEIFVAGTDGSDPTQVTTGSRLVGKPAVSPDGLSIAYSRAAGARTTQVVIRTLADGSERILSDEASESEPAFTADGQGVAVTSNLYGAPCIILRDAATGALVSRLTDRAGVQTAPAFAR